MAIGYVRVDHIWERHSNALKVLGIEFGEQLVAFMRIEDQSAIARISADFVIDGNPTRTENQIIDWLKSCARERIKTRDDLISESKLTVHEMLEMARWFRKTFPNVPIPVKFQASLE